MSLTPEREAELRELVNVAVGHAYADLSDKLLDGLDEALDGVTDLRVQVAALEEALLAAWPGLIEDEKYQRRAYEVPITEAWLLAKKALLRDVAGTREATSSGAGLPQGEYWLARGEQPERPPPDAEARAE